MLITPLAERILKTKKNELEKFINRNQKNKSLAVQLSVAKNDLSEVDNVLNEAKIVRFDEGTPVSVEIGTVIKVENLRTNNVREYTILTRSTSAPLNGIISNESPLAQKMLGLKLGTTFKFQEIDGHNDTFKIKSIE